MIMKRSNWDFQIEIEKQRPNIIVVHDNNLLFRYKREIILQNSGVFGEFQFYDFDKELKIDSEIEIITDPCLLTLNTRKTISHLHKQLNNEATLLGYADQVEQINKSMTDIIRKLRSDSLISYTYDDELGFEEFLKLYSVRYNEIIDNSDDLIVKYLDLIFEISKVKLLICFHFHHYLADAQIHELNKYLLYHNTPIIYFENFAPKESYNNYSVNILDEAMCYNNDV